MEDLKPALSVELPITADYLISDEFKIENNDNSVFYRLITTDE